jgi:hypothetical protein
MDHVGTGLPRWILWCNNTSHLKKRKAVFMNAEVLVEVCFECPHCKRKETLNFKNIEWNLTRDRCGDVEGIYFSLKCENCDVELYSETNDGKDYDDE